MLEIYDDPKAVRIGHVNEMGDQVMNDGVLSCSNARDRRIGRGRGIVDEIGRGVLDLNGVVGD